MGENKKSFGYRVGYYVVGPLLMMILGAAVVLILFAIVRSVL